MIVLGVILLLLGLLLSVPVLWVIGLVLVVVGAVLWIAVPRVTRSAVAGTTTERRGILSPPTRSERQEQSNMAHDASDDRTRRSRRVAIIGAGPGGICTAVSLLARGHDDFVILEQAPGHRRHLVPQPLPGRRVRHQVAPLLLLVRAQARVVAAVRRASPRSRPTWKTSSTASACAPTSG